MVDPPFNEHKNVVMGDGNAFRHACAPRRKLHEGNVVAWSYRLPKKARLLTACHFDDFLHINERARGTGRARVVYELLPCVASDEHVDLRRVGQCLNPLAWEAWRHWHVGHTRQQRAEHSRDTFERAIEDD